VSSVQWAWAGAGDVLKVHDLHHFTSLLLTSISQFLDLSLIVLGFPFSASSSFCRKVGAYFL
ncbi:hypothetical protein CDAR_543501, partial [Caerostris darwini]